MEQKNSNLIRVEFSDGNIVKIPSKYKAGYAAITAKCDLSKALAIKVNNKIESLDYELVKDSKVEFVTFESEEGYRIYSSTLKMVLYMALVKLDMNEFTVDFISTINKDQYFVMNNKKLTAKDIEKIKKKMIEIIKSDFPITRKKIANEEAEVLYKKSNDVSKLEQLENRLKDHTTMYFSDGLYNDFHSMLAPSTGYIKSFNLIKYRAGALLVYPDNLNQGYDFEKERRDTKLYESFESYRRQNALLGVNNIGNLNNAVLNGKISNVIQSSECIHQRDIVNILNKIIAKKNTKIILIAGPSSSGKTTFAQKLGIGLTLTGRKPVTISMDNYFKERKDTPLGKDGKYNFECVEALDIELFNKQMKELISGKKVELPEFDFFEGVKKYNGHFLKLEPTDILVVEGIHALNPVISKFAKEDQKFRIYIAPMATLNIDDYTKISSSDTRFLRRMVRDYVTRGHSPERTYELWKNVKVGEEKYIYPFVETADAIFNSSLIYEPGVMKTFAQPLLLQISRECDYYTDARRLYEYLENFLPIETGNIPVDSIIREFIGNGCFYR